jgi:hypothetical protein
METIFTWKTEQLLRISSVNSFGEECSSQVDATDALDHDLSPRFYQEAGRSSTQGILARIERIKKGHLLVLNGIGLPCLTLRVHCA